MNVHDEIDRFGEMNRKAYAKKAADQMLDSAMDLAAQLTAAQEREAKLKAEVEDWRKQFNACLQSRQGALNHFYEEKAKLQAEIERLNHAIKNHLCSLFEGQIKADNDKLRGVVDQIRSFVKEIREPRAWHGETMETKDEYRRGQDYVARKVQMILAESADALGGK